MAEKMDSLDLESLIKVIEGLPVSEGGEKLPSIDVLHRVLASAGEEDIPLLEWLAVKFKPYWTAGWRVIDLCITVIKSRSAKPNNSWSGEPEPLVSEDSSASITPVEPEGKKPKRQRRKRTGGGTS